MSEKMTAAEVNELVLMAPHRNRMRKANMEVLGLPRMGGLLVRNKRTGDVVLIDTRPREQRVPCEHADHRRYWLMRNGVTECTMCDRLHDV